MKTVKLYEYSDLKTEVQDKVRERRLNQLLKDLCEGSLSFNDELNGDDLQKQIDKAIAKAERMQTPWFAGEYLMEAVGDDLESMVDGYVQDLLFTKDGEEVGFADDLGV